MIISIIIFWLFFSFVAFKIAKNKGLPGFTYFGLSIFFSPIIGIIAALVAKPNNAAIERKRIKSGAMKRCPFCDELIKIKAITCRFCSKDLPAQEAKTENLDNRV